MVIKLPLFEHPYSRVLSLFDGHVIYLPRSAISGAFGPTSIAIAPAPPVGLALPVAYTAMSPATTRAYRPVWGTGVERKIRLVIGNFHVLHVQMATLTF